MRKFLVSCVAVLALAAPLASCGSDKPSKAKLIDQLKSLGASPAQAKCAADGIFRDLSDSELKKAASADKAKDLSAATTRKITKAVQACTSADSGSVNS